MKRYKIITIILFTGFFCISEIFGQESSKAVNYYQYKNSVESLYENVIEGNITEVNAFKELNSLKKNSFGNLKEFSSVLNKTIPSLIKQQSKIIKVDSSVTYTVQPNDNLWSIAQKTLKNSFKWLLIYNANKDKIPDPNVIHPDQQLVIPIMVSYLAQNNSSSQNNTKNFIIKDSTKTLDSLLALKNAINNQKDNDQDDSGINGMIVDQTDSKIGHDFYDVFYSNWQSPRNIKNYTITISEKPLPQLGTQITILINDTPIFQRFVQPRYEIIEQMAQQGAATAYSYLENYSSIQKQLQGDDLKGTGIY